MMTDILCPLSAALKERGENPAIISANDTISYRMLDSAVTNAIARLENLKFKQGMRVALYLQNSPQYIICLLALWRMGLVACPLSIRLPKTAVLSLLSQIN